MKKRMKKIVAGMMGTVVAPVTMGLATPVIEDKFFQRSASTQAYAQTEVHAQDSVPEKPFPFEVDLPQLTPEMREALKKYGFFENRNDKGELQYFVFDKETNDGIYEVLHPFKDKDYLEFRSRALETIKKSAPKELVESLKNLTRHSGMSVEANVEKLLNQYAEKVWSELFVRYAIDYTREILPQLKKEQIKILKERTKNRKWRGVPWYAGFRAENLPDTKIPCFRRLDKDFNLHMPLPPKSSFDLAYRIRYANLLGLLPDIEKKDNIVLIIKNFTGIPAGELPPINLMEYDKTDPKLLVEDINWGDKRRIMQEKVLMQAFIGKTPDGTEYVLKSCDSNLLIRIDRNGKRRTSLFHPTDDPKLMKLLAPIMEGPSEDLDPRTKKQHSQLLKRSTRFASASIQKNVPQHRKETTNLKKLRREQNRAGFAAMRHVQPVATSGGRSGFAG